MDLSMMLSTDKRTSPSPPAPSSHPAPTSHPLPSSKRTRPSSSTSPATPSPVSQAPSPYADLQRAVHAALENKEPSLSTSEKVALALEVLRARQLELDLAQARSNIEALVTRTADGAPRTLRAVIPASTVKGLPVGTPIEICQGRFLLSPTTNDPQALFLTLEVCKFGDGDGDGEGEKVEG